jgi:flagellar hook assembly protein FlgD
VVYDTAGREVRRIVSRGQPAGYYEAHWDGKDRTGRDAPPGVYFCRLEAGEFLRTEKLLLVR